jgi:5'-nucleotidase
MNNIPAIATSAFNGHLDICDFRDAADYIGLHLDKLLDLMGHSSDKIVLNVNTPAVDSQHYNGLKLCKLGLRMYTDFYEERKDPRGDTYYWLAGEMVNRDVDPEEDIEAIRNNYVTVTPIHADLTDEVVYESLKDRL